MTKKKAANAEFAKWWATATAAAKRELATAAKTSVAVLGHYAAGRRHITPEFAQRLAHASGGKLPQAALCDTCRRCPIRK